MTATMFEGRTAGGLRYAEIHHPAEDGWAGGTTQIVEGHDGRCHVGFKPGGDGDAFGPPRWRHWGEGQGGYEATRDRFDPSKPTPMPLAREGE